MSLDRGLEDGTLQRFVYRQESFRNVEIAPMWSFQRAWETFGRDLPPFLWRAVEVRFDRPTDSIERICLEYRQKDGSAWWEPDDLRELLGAAYSLMKSACMKANEDGRKAMAKHTKRAPRRKKVRE